MFGLLYLTLILIYVGLSILISKVIKKGLASLAYWILIALVPTWFVAGHYVYPSYFRFKSLCQSETLNTYSYDKDRKSLSQDIWLIPNRLIKHRSVYVDDSSAVAHEIVSFNYYPFGTKAILLGGSSGSAPSQSCSGKSNLEEFISKHIKISPIKQQIIGDHAMVISDFSQKDISKIERGRSGDFVWCKSKVVGKGYNDSPGLDISYLIKGIPLHRKYSIEKTICTSEHIYIVETPANGNEFIQIYTYDYQGMNLENQKFPVPSRVWRGYPRKPLIYFDVNFNQVIIGIEEFGDYMDSEIIYYKLQLSATTNN